MLIAIHLLVGSLGKVIEEEKDIEGEIIMDTGDEPCTHLRDNYLNAAW